jgi:hypothetical protein
MVKEEWAVEPRFPCALRLRIVPSLGIGKAKAALPALNSSITRQRSGVLVRSVVMLPKANSLDRLNIANVQGGSGSRGP